MGLTNRHLTKHLKTSAELKELLKVIDSLPFRIGAQPFGKDEDLQTIIANFIMKKYSGLTPDNIVEAFESAAVGELYSEGKRIDVKTYGNTLDIELIGRVLTAWREDQRTKDMRSKAYGEGMTEDVIDMPDAKWHYESLLKQIKAMGAMPEFGLWKIIHRHLVSEGILKPLKRKVTSKPEDVRSILLGDLHRIEIRNHLITTEILKG